MIKTTKHCWKKWKITQINGKTSCALGLEDLILFTCSYYPKQSTDSYQHPNRTLCINRKKKKKILEVLWNLKGPLTAKKEGKKESTFLDFKTYCRTTVIKTVR